MRVPKQQSRGHYCTHCSALGLWWVYDDMSGGRTNGTGRGKERKGTKKRNRTPKTGTCCARNILTNFSIWNQPLDKRTRAACDCFGTTLQWPPVIAKTFLFSLIFILRRQVLAAIHRRRRRHRRRSRRVAAAFLFAFRTALSRETFFSGVL